jgi:uncharacterized protein involved in cysteine biosynthesis
MDSALAGKATRPFLVWPVVAIVAWIVAVAGVLAHFVYRNTKRHLRSNFE